MEKRRVCITGIGAVTPLGNSREETWRRVLAGESGATPISTFDAETWPTTFACEVKNFALPENAAIKSHAPFLNRPTRFGMAAALEAFEDSGIIGLVPGHRMGISIGGGIGAICPHELAMILRGIESSRKDEDKSGLHAMPELSRFIENAKESKIILQNHPGTLSALLSARWQIYGPVTTIHTACASSSQSVGQGFLQIQRGEADVIVAGGADSLSGELLLAGFCLLGALSRRNSDPQSASRPFDKDRDGFVAGEGAAILILEEREHALARGAKIYCELVGYGETESAYRITDLPPDGRGIVEAMQDALREARINPSEVGYINAHGTSTDLNDRIEALAIRRVFTSEVNNKSPMISSTKSEVGHLISAAGALEASFCALALRDGKIPPTRNLFQTDCGDDLDFVAHEMRTAPIDVAMSNSIGFGGSNSVLVFKGHV